MHSSRMRTVRCSSHLLGGGGICAGGVFPGECLNRGVSTQGGVCRGGCLSRGCLPGGVSGQGGVYLVYWGCLADIPPWTEFLTHTCENITFPQLRLRTVKMVPVMLVCHSVHGGRGSASKGGRGSASRGWVGQTLPIGYYRIRSMS